MASTHSDDVETSRLARSLRCDDREQRAQALVAHPLEQAAEVAAVAGGAGQVEEPEDARSPRPWPTAPISDASGAGCGAW